MQPHRIRELMEHVAPVIGAEAVVEYDPSTWSIDLGGSGLILAELDNTARLLTLSVELGSVSPERSRATWELALVANYVPVSGEVVRLALDGPGGNLMLLQSVPTEGLDAAQLTAAVERYVQLAGRWGRALQEGGVDDSPAASSQTPADASASPGLRV